MTDVATMGKRTTAGDARLTRLGKVLACPECRTSVHPDGDLTCVSCGFAGTRRGTQLKFGGFEDSELKEDPLNRIKETVKRRLAKVYPVAIGILAPVLTTRFVKPFLRSFDLDQDLVADLGAGTHRRDNRLICVDGGTYDNLDIVTDLRKLPLADGALSGAMSIAVLEHVPDPSEHIAEVRRVLAPGGRFLCFIPFMQPFHASPWDFQRYTKVGIQEQFPGFEILSVKVGAGPTSALVWVLQEWLALTLSFGIKPLYRLLVPLTWILSPLKLLDLLLAHHPEASVIASGFVIEVRKPAE